MCPTSPLSPFWLQKKTKMFTPVTELKFARCIQTWPKLKTEAKETQAHSRPCCIPLLRSSVSHDASSLHRVTLLLLTLSALHLPSTSQPCSLCASSPFHMTHHGHSYSKWPLSQPYLFLLLLVFIEQLVSGNPTEKKPTTSPFPWRFSPTLACLLLGT